MRLITRFVLLVVSVLFIAGGIGGIRTAKLNPEPQVVTLDAVGAAADLSWLKLEQVVVFLPGAIIRKSSSGTIKGAYIPLFDSEDATGPVLALMTTDDAEIGAALAKMNEMSSNTAELLIYVAEHRDELIFRRTIDGSVRTLSEISTSDREQLQAAEDNLAPDAVIIRDGMRPGYAAPTVVLILGVFGLAWRARSWSRARAARQVLAANAPTPEALPAS